MKKGNLITLIKQQTKSVVFLINYSHKKATDI